MDAGIIEALKAAVGPKGFLETEADKAPFLTDERDLYHGAAALVLRPANTAEVAEIVRICAGASVGVVPQGGNTGYCGGSIPGRNREEVVVATELLTELSQLGEHSDLGRQDSQCIAIEQKLLQLDEHSDLRRQDSQIMVSEIEIDLLIFCAVFYDFKQFFHSPCGPG